MDVRDLRLETSAIQLHFEVSWRQRMHDLNKCSFWHRLSVWNDPLITWGSNVHQSQLKLAFFKVLPLFLCRTAAVISLNLYPAKWVPVVTKLIYISAAAALSSLSRLYVQNIPNSHIFQQNTPEYIVPSQPSHMTFTIFNMRPYIFHRAPSDGRINDTL